MKSFLTLVALVAACSVANAAPVTLSCESNASDEELEAVVIRFDEADRTFELYGKSMWSIRTDSDEGGAKVKDAEFNGDTIVVKFKRRAALFVNVWAIAASGGRTGVLDRRTGTWTLGKHVYQCSAIEGSESRQF